jgi:hypothetical protein
LLDWYRDGGDVAARLPLLSTYLGHSEPELEALLASLREDVLTPALNAWIGRLFHRDNRDETVRALVASQPGAARTGGSEATQRRLATATATVKNCQAAIAAGVDPTAMIEVINQAQADRETAQAELDHITNVTTLDEAEVYAMLDSLGDVGAVLHRGHPDHLARLYQALHVEIDYQHAETPGQAHASLRVSNECVRGATCAQTPRRDRQGRAPLGNPKPTPHRRILIWRRWAPPRGSLTSSCFAIQELLGHAWTGTTARYIHVHGTHVEDAWVAGQQRATDRWKGLA